MSWSIGFDARWNRDIGYGVPAICDHPDCSAEIDRGLAYVCGGEPYGGERGCGLYFCGKHRDRGLICDLCERCARESAPFDPKPDAAEWVRFKLKDRSWAKWRRGNPEAVATLRALTACPPGRTC